MHTIVLIGIAQNNLEILILVQFESEVEDKNNIGIKALVLVFKLPINFHQSAIIFHCQKYLTTPRKHGDSNIYFR